MDVIIARSASYAPAAVEAGIREICAGLGGLERWIQPGQRVLIKPNMLEALAPEKAATTHPAVLAALIRAVQAVGGRVLVGDSPGVQGTLPVAEACGIAAVCRENGAALVDFNERRDVCREEGRTVKRFALAAALAEADVVISLAKMKTHSLMGVTGSVKNLFGCIVGTDKAQFHLRMKWRDDFAGMLVDLYQTVQPTLCFVDGIVGMEGNGPRNGQAKPAGLLLGGVNGFAVDMAMTAVMGLPVEAMPVTARALAAGLVAPWDALALGGSGCDCRLAFAPPKHLESVDGWLTPRLAHFFQNQFTAKPYITEACIGCGRCCRHCPPQAMQLANGRPRIDYRQCIRCYCCQELCPADAVALKAGLLLRGVRRLQRR